MKRWYSAVAGIAAVAALAGTAFANAATPANSVRVATVTPVKTPPLRDIQKSLNVPPMLRQLIGGRNLGEQQIAQLREKLVRSGYLRPLGEKYDIPTGRLQPAGNRSVHVADPVRQSKWYGPDPNSITAGVSFAGIGVSGGDDPTCSPPDTDMAAGDDYVVEIVNLCSGAGVSVFEVWDKDGNVVLPTTSLAGLWSAGSGCDTGNGSAGILFDQLADRWIMEQINNAKTGICVAVSQTSDPTGSYSLYNFVIDPDGNIDYPRLGLWPDGYYVTTNDWTQDLHVNFTALNRSQMLAGQTAPMIVRNGMGHNEGGVDYYVLPASLDGMAPPPAGDPGIFLNLTSPYLTPGTPYALDMWRMTVDWNNPENSTLTGPTVMEVDAINDGVCGAWVFSCIPQPVGGYPLHVHDDHLMSRLPYRNFGDHQALVTNTTVGTGAVPSSPPAGIRWYVLNAPAGATSASAFTVATQATYLPGDGNSRWTGSIAMDHMGNIGLGYSVSSSSLDPSAAFTGHNVDGPSGVMDAGETLFVTGTGVQEDTGELEGDWGSGSAMVIDPADDCTFWTAQEYISETGMYHWSTAIGAFKFDNCTTVATATVGGKVSDRGHGYPLYAEVVATSGGATVADVWTNPRTGAFRMRLPANAHYTVTVSALFHGYQTKRVAGTLHGDMTKSFVLSPNASCTAPGYHSSGGECEPIPGGVVEGLVVQRSPRVPLDGATVSDENDNSSTTTTVNGHRGVYAMFEPTGAHTLTASKSGYQDAVKNLQVANGKIVVALFGLNAD